MRTTSPSWQVLPSSWALNFTVLFIIFPYLGWGCFSATATTMVFSILLETTVPTFSFLGIAMVSVSRSLSLLGLLVQDGFQLGHPVLQLAQQRGVVQLVQRMLEAGFKQLFAGRLHLGVQFVRGQFA